ncbi:hypothetical protein QBC39DRAFT_257354 [Podospora conica]|nr:hypothetical protein QBC39DRAFT_257354 [Schizothecium conicum]
MGKPRLLILIRHAQSEGNRNRDIHQTVPDHRVKLTQEGWQQAYEAGRRLRKLLRPNDTLHFFTSPYRRTRETTEGILATLTSDDPDPSPFKRNNIKVYEEPRLREQDFGNFQPCSAEMERMWQERADYGHFFYRIPNGESAADAYDRISGFNESLWRQFGEDDFASVCVLVTHGLMSRVFLMKWYHFSVEYFEDLRNVNHCEFLIMRQHDETGKYILENKLRTWSELKREKQALKDKAAAEGNGNGNGATRDTATLTRAMSSTTVLTKSRRWGGCPNGCNHDKSFKIRAALADLVQSDSIISDGPPAPGTEAKPAPAASSKAEAPRAQPPVVNPSFNGTANGQTATTGSQASTTLVSRRPAAAKRFQSHDSGESSGGLTPIAVPTVATTPQIDVDRARDDIVSSPDGTPSFISVEDRLRNHLKSPSSPPPAASSLDPLAARTRQQLHVGRDFGGTYSGHSSAVASDADSSEDDKHRRRRFNGSNSSSGNSISLNGIMAAGATTVKHSSSLAVQHLAVLSSSSSSNVGRDHSRMGRGIRANRLGDHPHSSDGEHEADNEHEHDNKCVHGHAHDDGDVSDEGEEGVELSRTLTDEADDALLMRAEMEDRSIQGSVY